MCRQMVNEKCFVDFNTGIEVSYHATLEKLQNARSSKIEVCIKNILSLILPLTNAVNFLHIC